MHIPSFAAVTAVQLSPTEEAINIIVTIIYMQFNYFHSI